MFSTVKTFTIHSIYNENFFILHPLFVDWASVAKLAPHRTWYIDRLPCSSSVAHILWVTPRIQLLSMFVFCCVSRSTLLYWRGFQSFSRFMLAPRAPTNLILSLALAAAMTPTCNCRLSSYSSPAHLRIRPLFSPVLLVVDYLIALSSRTPRWVSKHKHCVIGYACTHLTIHKQSTLNRF